MPVTLVAPVKKSDLERDYNEEVVEKFLNPLIVRINSILSHREKGYPAKDAVTLDLDVLVRQGNLDMNLLNESTKEKIVKHFSTEFTVKPTNQYKHRLIFS